MSSCPSLPIKCSQCFSVFRFPITPPLLRAPLYTPPFSSSFTSTPLPIFHPRKEWRWQPLRPKHSSASGLGLFVLRLLHRWFLEVLLFSFQLRSLQFKTCVYPQRAHWEQAVFHWRTLSDTGSSKTAVKQDRCPELCFGFFLVCCIWFRCLQIQTLGTSSQFFYFGPGPFFPRSLRCGLLVVV